MHISPPPFTCKPLSESLFVEVNSLTTKYLGLTNFGYQILDKRERITPAKCVSKRKCNIVGTTL